MRELTAREKRTVRLGLAIVVVYLACFGGLEGWKSFSKTRTDYQQLVRQAETLRQELQPYESKVPLVRKLMENFRLDPASLTNSTLVAEASAAIQQAAMASGVMLGAVREESARGSMKELATIKLEGNGPVPAVMTFLHRLQSLGYPLIVDSVQIGSESGRPGGPVAAMGAMPRMGPPGMLKLSLTIVILNFEQWKNEETPNA